MALQDYYNTGDSTSSSVTAVSWRCQTFIAGDDYEITSVKLKLYRQGSPGILTVTINNTIDGKPTDVLATGTIDSNTFTENTNGAWEEITFVSPYALSNGVLYAIVLNVPGTRVKWRLDDSAPLYPDGKWGYSEDSGSTWTVTTARDFMFETYSTAVIMSGASVGTSGLSGALSYAILAITGTIVGVSGSNAILGTGMFIDGTIAAVAALSGDMSYLGILGKTNIHTNKRIIAAGNNEIWYEDV